MSNASSASRLHHGAPRVSWSSTDTPRYNVRADLNIQRQNVSVRELEAEDDMCEAQEWIRCNQ